MVDDDILGADGRETIAAEFANALGEADGERLEHQIGAVGHDELGGIGQSQHALFDVHVRLADFELLDHESPELLRHRGVDLQSDDRTASPPLQCALEQTHEVFRFLLHFDIAVAQHAKRPQPGHVIAGEKTARKKPDQRLHAHETHSRLGARLHIGVDGQSHETVQLRGNRHQRVHRRARAVARQFDADGKALVGHERKGVRRIDRNGRQHREDLRNEIILEPRVIGDRKVVRLHDRQVGGRHLGPETPPTGLLLVGEFGDCGIDRGQLLFGRQTVLADRRHFGAHLTVQARHAHHEKFVEVGRGNRQEAQLLEQRVARVLRLFQHAMIEFEPGQLTVEKAL